MKGVILGINPRARIVDLTHEIPAGDIESGAFALAAACGFFPKGTIHVAVVDPGVGSPRRAIAMRTERFTFIGPDNGLLSLALARETVKTIRLLENPGLLAKAISNTFHGRDVYAPVAAHLSQGIRFRTVGSRAGSYVQLKLPEPVAGESGIDGEIMHFDQFGNAITNISGELLPDARGLHVYMRGEHLCRVEPFYAAVPSGSPAAVVGSTGFLEIAINKGSAEQALGLQTGNPVTIRPSENPC